MTITLVVTYCLVLNATMCWQMRMVPEDFHAVTSMGECLMGGAIGSTTFIMENAEYFVKGWHCISSPPKDTDVSEWVQAEKERLKRAEPQIK